jgi:hypothetical protein
MVARGGNPGRRRAPAAPVTSAASRPGFPPRATVGRPYRGSTSWAALVLLLALLPALPLPAHAADLSLATDLSLDVTAEHLSASFAGNRSAEASAVTFGLGLTPGDRVSLRVEVPVVRARSSQPLWAQLGATPRVLRALEAGNLRLLQQVPGDWESGLGDLRIEAQADLAGGGARLYHWMAELDVKAPTADVEEGLGTGEWDARIGLVGERRFWSATLFGGAGYSRLGDLRKVELRDVPDAFVGVESEPWWGLRAALWIEGQSAVLAGQEARSAVGFGLRSSGHRPWRLVATVGLTGSEEEIGLLFGTSLRDASGGLGWGRPAGRRSE